ncbi:NAD(P)-dependent oxidoreductase [Methylomonas sp. MO1]|uniref:NAD-dependent epimerase/dehydratase family protein n=1 Tax=Methylomonas sp. MO1 TaxID=3073619 RepID=UPI0028A3C111|nr:NAD(P)-dependent oxidoreductase [Methylomonas sp. MO1]MDT4288741.1 NAD(P)-dependent oxidoreductase [Methylomonas sp. MO1]
MAVNYFITGICGFVGSELAIALAKAGYRVAGVDRMMPHADTAGEFATLGIRFHHLDLLDRSGLAPLLTDIDIVVHAAGVSRVSDARANPMECVNSTVLATTNLIELLAGAARKPLIIYLSTREVSYYDTLDDTQVNVDHIYAISKKSAEQLLLAFANSYEMPLAICRLSDVYGGKRDHVNKLLPTFVKRAKQNQAVRVLNNQTRFHFTHIQDVIDSILDIVMLLQTSGHRQRCFELWSDESYTAEELAALVVSSFKSNSRIDYAVHGVVQDIGRIRLESRTWQFSPKFSLKEELNRLSESY